MKPVHWGIRPQVRPAHFAWIVGCLAILSASAAAEPAAIVPDPPAARQPVTVSPGRLPASSDLDGTYLWLGPVGAASHVEGRWDSTFGAQAAVIAVREGAGLGVLGATAGATRWTGRGGGRIWLDAVAGTRLAGHMMGASLGPILELSDLAHPRLGGALGLWGFAGITPFARFGAVSNLGMFAEVGIYLALPVLRR